MNWNEIKEKYPKSWGKVADWGDNSGIWGTPEEISSRYLYDFFDENGIIVTIRYISSLGAFRYRIHIGGKITDWRPTADNPSEVKFRTKAEIQAFNKCFEILEKNISQTGEPNDKDTAC